MDGGDCIMGGGGAYDCTLGAGRGGACTAVPTFQVEEALLRRPVPGVGGGRGNKGASVAFLF